MINGGVRLKKDVDWEVLDKYGFQMEFIMMKQMVT